MMVDTFTKPLVQELDYPDWRAAGIHVNVLRDDLIHPYISGNKARKLKYNLSHFGRMGKKVMVTFGGAFSNHLLAVAAASKMFAFKSVGIIRGERVINPYTTFMQESGMKLHFISREEYRRKDDAVFIEELLKSILPGLQKDDIYVIPEGGSNELAIKGAAEITNDIPSETDYIACACGTGATAAGISQTLMADQLLLAIPVLKAENYIERQVRFFGGNTERMILKDDYHFGGYAKSSGTLNSFCKSFSLMTGVPVEPVYTGKLMFAIDDLVRKKFFSKGKRITIVHTGGVSFYPGMNNQL
jgi:1-aminocyclopropane-1-carboxylate deaminase